MRTLHRLQRFERSPRASQSRCWNYASAIMGIAVYRPRRDRDCWHITRKAGRLLPQSPPGPRRFTSVSPLRDRGTSLSTFTLQDVPLLLVWSTFPHYTGCTISCVATGEILCIYFSLHSTTDMREGGGGFRVVLSWSGNVETFVGGTKECATLEPAGEL